jgi:hypothetical protein
MQQRQTELAMNFEAAERIAKTLLYEGYVLYPYRPSALKNHQRWMFGTLLPKCEGRVDSLENPSSLQAECVALVSARTVLKMKFRFLHLTERDQRFPSEDSSDAIGEAQEREVVFGPVLVSDLVSNSVDIPFYFGVNDATKETEAALRGHIHIEACAIQNNLSKITAKAENCTPLSDSRSTPAVRLLSRSLASPQLLFGIENGEFLSLLDPPEQFRAAVANCRNFGVFPVLVGENSDRSMMLATPIILYDYPQVAPESSGDFYDATEIDELLVLRLKTLSDEEKTQIQRAKLQPRQILDRAEGLSTRTMASLHGRVRMLDLSAAEKITGEHQTARDSLQIVTPTCKIGDRVRLCPRKSADIMDIALKGQVAIVESTETDYEGNLHVAVVLENDPGAEFGFQRQIGHRFFFSPEELEPLGPKEPAGS